MYYKDDFNVTFEEESAFYKYLDDVEKRAEWFRAQSKDLTVEAVTKDSTCTPRAVCFGPDHHLRCGKFRSQYLLYGVRSEPIYCIGRKLESASQQLQGYRRLQPEHGFYF